MQITDDGGVDLREFGVVYQEPRFPRPVDGRSLDGGLLGVWGGKAGTQHHAIGTHEGFGEIVFVIGSSCGLSKIISDRADFKLSLSKMTFLHQFARLILTEQIYRAFKIIKGETYHK